MGSIPPLVDPLAVLEPRRPATNLSRVAEVAAETESALGGAAVGLLGELIRLDTVNPPGNEGRAAELLADVLAGAGLDCELLGAEPGRENLLARLAGEAEGPTLCLLGHLDTVTANPDDWSFDPWAGDVVGGAVRGRGAQDMKGQVAAEVAAAAALARAGWRPQRGELLIAAVADEETGGHLGARWLCAEHPGKLAPDWVVNEGGGTAFELDGTRFYPLCVAEKGVVRFKLRTRGRAGHAAVPGLGDNALLKLAPLISRLADQPPLEATPEGVAFLGALVGDGFDGAGPDELAAALSRVRERSPALATYLAEPMLRVTMTPTRAAASPKANVIPDRAEVLVDCRVPPELGEDHVRERIAALVGPGDYEVEFTERDAGNRSAASGELAEAIARWVGRADPGARVVPVAMPMFSDSNWFRRAFPDATVYGFCPQRGMLLAEAAPLVHGADERIEAADIARAAEFFGDLATELLG
jgi:acetylornithine deacetylase/succinyl-diaminopimelate desuccinylase-like protein